MFGGRTHYSLTQFGIRGTELLRSINLLVCSLSTTECYFCFHAIIAVKCTPIGIQFKFYPLYFYPPTGSIISGPLSVMCPHSSVQQRLLPSDSSSLAGPRSSVCSIHGIVKKQRGLYFLTWMDVWGSFHFGWQGYSERLFVQLHSCCVSSSSAPPNGQAGRWSSFTAAEQHRMPQQNKTKHLGF